LLLTVNQKLMITTRLVSKKFLAGGALFALAGVFIGAPGAHAMSVQLDFGSRGVAVSDLQTYLSTNSNIYPSHLVTGYFGQLTKEGVQRFQTAQGIVSSGTPQTTGYGRVGPATLARLNAVMPGDSAYVNSVPILGAPSVQYGNTTATISWSTNEPTQGQLYWGLSPIQADEATGPNQMPYISGALAVDAGGLQTNHTVTVSNLQTNTTYYYLIRAIDGEGGITIMWPSQSFHTAQ
jgi:peptidoglycan hydrolase-like protein with peptidoglycan-binding domain